jgi:hypothetical protein
MLDPDPDPDPAPPPGEPAALAPPVPPPPPHEGAAATISSDPSAASGRRLRGERGMIMRLMRYEEGRRGKCVDERACSLPCRDRLGYDVTFFDRAMFLH